MIFYVKKVHKHKQCIQKMIKFPQSSGIHMGTFLIPLMSIAYEILTSDYEKKYCVIGTVMKWRMYW